MAYGAMAEPIAECRLPISDIRWVAISASQCESGRATHLKSAFGHRHSAIDSDLAPSALCPATMPSMLAETLIAFGRLLRDAGLAVTPEQSRVFGDALARLGLANRRDVKAA